MRELKIQPLSTSLNYLTNTSFTNKVDIKSVNNEIANIMRQSNGEFQQLHLLKKLVEQRGYIACQAIFNVLADLNFNEEVALSHWHAVYTHAFWLSEILGRPVAVVTAICDYFSGEGKLIIGPKLTTLDKFDSLIEHSTFDRLTGLLNRNCFNDTLTHLIALTERENTELALTFLDIDDFKDINDRYGHQIGDIALKALGKLLSTSIRQSDIALRYGGEEFVILMPNTNCHDALMLSNRIRKKVEKQSLVQNGIQLNVTLSGGVAVYPLQAKTAKELVFLADHSLYQAKAAGKNNIYLFNDESRNCIRVPLMKAIQIKEMVFNQASFYDGFSKNISNGGILFESLKRYEIGSNLQVSLEMNGTKAIMLLGTVVRIETTNKDSYTIAVSFSFDDIEKTAQKDIAKLVVKCNGSIHCA